MAFAPPPPPHGDHDGFLPAPSLNIGANIPHDPPSFEDIEREKYELISRIETLQSDKMRAQVELNKYQSQLRDKLTMHKAIEGARKALVDIVTERESDILADQLEHFLQKEEHSLFEMENLKETIDAFKLRINSCNGTIDMYSHRLHHLQNGGT